MALAAAPRPAAAQRPVVDVIPYPAEVQRTGGTLTFVGAPVIVTGDPADAQLEVLAQDAVEMLGESVGRHASSAIGAPGRLYPSMSMPSGCEGP